MGSVHHLDRGRLVRGPGVIDESLADQVPVPVPLVVVPVGGRGPVEPMNPLPCSMNRRNASFCSAVSKTTLSVLRNSTASKRAAVVGSWNSEESSVKVNSIPSSAASRFSRSRRR